MFFAPAYAGLKVVARFNVNVLPLSEAELPARLIAHCEFCSVLLDPSVAGVHADEASLSRLIEPFARLYWIMHELLDVDANVALNQTQAVDRSDAPAVSEYCNANV